MLVIRREGGQYLRLFSTAEIRPCTGYHTHKGKQMSENEAELALFRARLRVAQLLESLEELDRLLTKNRDAANLIQVAGVVRMAQIIGFRLESVEDSIEKSAKKEDSPLALSGEVWARRPRFGGKRRRR